VGVGFGGGVGAGVIVGAGLAAGREEAPEEGDEIVGELALRLAATSTLAFSHPLKSAKQKEKSKKFLTRGNPRLSRGRLLESSIFFCDEK